MIKIIKISDSAPYKIFLEHFNQANKANQNPINAISISSFDRDKDEVVSRFVNLKYIEEEKWIFFSNYNSPKAIQFDDHNQISALIYWESINVQIRIKAKIEKSSSQLSDQHFKTRLPEKNALAISSDQSKKIQSYEMILNKYHKTLEESELLQRPEYWGGFTFTPYYFEFWEGQKYRLNKRSAYTKKGNDWEHFLLEP